MRGPSRARLIVVALGVVIATLASGTALAYFTTTGSGAAAAGVSNLSKPVISSATPAVGGTVTVTWGAVTAPGAGAVTYFVTRDGGPAAGTCPTSAAPAAVTTCVDKGVEPGSHSYAVTAIWGPWTTLGPTTAATVTVGAATHLDLTAASASPVAGATDNLTIVAEDVNGAKVTTYTGAKNLTFSGASASPSGTAPTVANSSGTAVAFGTATAITFTSGAATVTTTKNGVMKLYRAGAASISVTDGSLVAETPLAVTVSNSTLSKLVLSAETATPAVGAADDLTTSAQDTYGNVVPTYTGSKSLTFTGAVASPSGTVPTVTNSSGEAIAFATAIPIAFEAGIATASGSENGEMRLYKSIATSVKVSDGTLTSAAVTITPPAGGAVKLVLASSASTLAAGATSNLTITAQDTYGNTATTYTGSRGIFFSGAGTSIGGTAPTVVNAAGTAIALGAETVLTFTAGVAAVSASKNGLYKPTKAEVATLSATDGTISTATSPTVIVTPTTASKFAFTHAVAGAGSLSNPCYFNCTATGIGNAATIVAGVAVTDTYGNVVNNLGSGHSVAVTATGGTVTGGTYVIPTTGAAESATDFTYTSPASGAFSNTIKAAATAGTAYTNAMITATK